MKKYKLVEHVLDWADTSNVLYRIKALQNFGDVRVGDLGGFVKSENNLSHDGTCWIYDTAQVSNEAVVCDNAKVCGNSHLFDSVRIYGNAYINHVAMLCNSEVFDNAIISGGGRFRTVKISHDVKIHGNSYIRGDVHIYGDSEVYDHAVIIGNGLSIYGNFQVKGTASMYLTNVTIVSRSGVTLNNGNWITKINKREHRYLISTTLERLKVDGV